MPHTKHRYLFIDLLRFLAVVFMVQGHTFDALLDFDLRSATLFYAHDFFHGFIAPMFLFASGVAFGISTLKKWEEHTVLSMKVWRRFGKFAGLLLIGYALHLPYFSLSKLLTQGTPGDWAVWLQVDALHCIAATMFLLQGLVLVVRTERRFIAVTAGTAVLIIFASPLVWSSGFTDGMPLWLASYVNASNNSWFPLFPWAAYILTGVTFAWFFLEAKEHHHAVQLMQRAVSVGTVLLLLAAILANIPFHLYPPHDFWKVNPLMILARIGFVLLVTSAVFFAEHSFHLTSPLPSILGRESLFIYILHLIILYGSVVNNGLQQIVLPTLSVGWSFVSFVSLFLVLTAITVLWSRLKRWSPLAAMTARASLAVIFLLNFLTRPY